MSFTKETIPPLAIIRGNVLCPCDPSADFTSLLCGMGLLWLSDGVVVHDPDGSLQKQYGEILIQGGYAVKTLNLSEPKQSGRYNPFMYLRHDNSNIGALAAAIIGGTTGLGTPGDAGFESLEALLLEALIGYVYNETPPFDHNFRSVMLMLENMDRDEDWHKTAVDFMFKEAEESGPELIAVQKYNAFLETAAHDEAQVIASCAARLAPLNTEEMLDFMSADEFNFDTLTLPKTVLFVIDGGADAKVSFIAPLFYTQLFDCWK